MNSVLLAFAMFSRIPVPNVAWNEKNMRYLLAAFPLVGVAVGAALLAWDWLCASLALGGLLRGAGFVLLPLLITGGIHMDGFCDTVDALASHGDVEKKRRILKDPHIGSFAAIAACAYIVVFSALGAEAAFSFREMLCFSLTFMLSRSMAGLAVILFPCSPESGLGRSFQSAAHKRSVLAVLLAVIAGLGLAMTLLGGVAGVVAFGGTILLLGWCRRVAAVHFGGMGGDLSGWLLQMCEILSLAALVLVPRIVDKL